MRSTGWAPSACWCSTGTSTTATGPTTSSTTSDEVLYVSIHQSPLYPGTGALTENGAGAGEGYTVNLPVPPGAGHAEWLGAGRARRGARSRARTPRTCCWCRPGSTPTATTRSRTATLTEESYAAMAAAMRTLVARARRAARLRARGRLRPARAGGVGRGDDRGARWTAPRPSRRRSRRAAPARGARARTTRRWWPRLAPSDVDRRAKRRAPCKHGALAPRYKAPQRLALPPGSLVCNGRRKGDRRGAVVAMREAMALRAVRPEAVERPPVPAGLPRPDALGRDRPLMDGAPALDALARRPWEVSAATFAPREACRACGAPGASARPEKANDAGRTAVPFRGCQDGSSLSLRIPDPVGPWS